MKNGFFENFAKFTGKHLRFAKFSRTPFLQNTSTTATLLRWGTANSVWKTSDEYSLSRNTNLRITVQVYHFFLGSINFHCIFSSVQRVHCQKQPPDQTCSVEKGVLKNFVNFTRKHLCWSLFLIKFRPGTCLEEHLPKTAFALHTSQSLLGFTLYLAPSSSSLLLLRSSRPVVFYKTRCSQKFCKIHRKTPVPESLF